MVELNKVEEVLQDGVRLVLSDAHDATREVRVDKDGLPASYWVCSEIRSEVNMQGSAHPNRRYLVPYDRVDGLEVVTNIAGRSTLTLSIHVNYRGASILQSRLTVTQLVTESSSHMVEEASFVDSFERF